MNKCMELDIQEMLPDLLHRSLDAGTMQHVEAHVASCESCAEELEVLRTVKAAAVFAPAIDVNAVVGQIPPYKKIAPASQLPARSRMVSWLVAAGLMIVVAGGGSLLMVQPKGTVTRGATLNAPSASSKSPAAPLTPAPAGNVGGNAAAPATHALALGAGVDALSDSDLRQLMNDMDTFDALPNAEAEPVITVDNGDTASETR
jgi:hypothetical protein